MPTVPRRVFRVGAATALAAAVIQTTIHLVNWLAGPRYAVLNADLEGSLANWAGTVTIFAAAGCAAALAVLEPARRRMTGLLAVVLLALSLDDGAGLHERIEAHNPFHRSLSLWPAVYLPVLGLALLALVRVSSRGPARGPVRAGVALLALAVAAEVFWSPRHSDYWQWSNAVEIAFEEGLELAGWVLVVSGLGGLALALQRRRPRRSA